MVTKETRLRLVWGPKEIQDLHELIDDLRLAIEDAPCEIACDGECTYECPVDRLCRVCRWRVGALNILKDYEAWRPDSSK